ncbi:hypothetical protein O181_119066 [Austropuccinia psidii MF-1]|uniref:Uncharacterized protein n=1 Tax=Austropuccinia psidii MF-1 TaxID=1389203 RepID=A0A9Q3PZB7_9BASI|nr:hypothetical protein [Austropuccinia psidii MF-1]
MEILSNKLNMDPYCLPSAESLMLKPDGNVLLEFVRLIRDAGEEAFGLRHTVRNDCRAIKAWYPFAINYIHQLLEFINAILRFLLATEAVIAFIETTYDELRCTYTHLRPQLELLMREEQQGRSCLALD